MIERRTRIDELLSKRLIRIVRSETSFVVRLWIEEPAQDVENTLRIQLAKFDLGVRGEIRNQVLEFRQLSNRFLKRAPKSNAVMS